MNIHRFSIGSVPAVLYGEPAEQGYLFLHGQMGCKEEAEPFAQLVCARGGQVLSIDPVSYTHLDVYKRQPLYSMT